MQDVFNYYAFISYKHEDEKYAKWLQKRLESYRLPSALQNEDVPKRIKPVFRDQTDLTPGQPLKDSIKDKLRLSKYLIVICSKNLAKESEYVNYEINSFVEMGRADRIIPVIIDGEPNAQNMENECFCSALKQIPGEILAADSVKDGRRIASLKVIAALFQLNADDLIKRDERRKIKSGLLIATASVLLSVLAIFALNTIFNLSFSYNLEEAINAYAEKDYTAAANFAVKALNVPGKKDGEQEAEAILRGSVISQELKNTNTQFHKEYEIEFPNEAVGLYGESKDGSKVAFTDYSKVWVYDEESGEKIATYDTRTEKEALDEYLNPVNNPDDLALNTRGEKKESEKYSQEIYLGTLFFMDGNGNVVSSFYVDDTAKWVYSADDSFVVVYTGDTYNDTYVYSFEKKLCIRLSDEHLNVSRMWLSEKGRYVFISYRIKHLNYSLGWNIAVYDTESGSYIAGFSDAELYLEESLVDTQVFYILQTSLVEKYVFEDVAPDFEGAYDAEYGYDIMPSNSKIQDCQFSDDGKRAYTIKQIYNTAEHFHLYSIFDVKSGDVIRSFTVDYSKSDIAFDKNLKHCIISENKNINIIDIDSNEVLYYKNNYANVNSVAISEEGVRAAYSIENGNIYILEKNGKAYFLGEEKNGDAYSVKDIIFGSSYEGETGVSAISYDICIFADDNKSYIYNIEDEKTEEFFDKGNYYSTKGYYYDRYSVFKFEKFLEDRYLEPDFYAGEYDAFDYETGEGFGDDFLILPWNYSDKTKILAGADYTNQIQVNSEIQVIRVDGNKNEELYRYAPSFSTGEIYFDNTGEYIILVGDKGSEVIVAETGERLFTIDRKIRIHDGIIYDVSSDLVIPNKLPTSEISTVKEFKQRARELE